MASERRSYSIHWNEGYQQFVARYRKVGIHDDEAAWGTKRIPKGLLRHQALDAERWLISWLAAYQQTGGLNVGSRRVVAAPKTLKLLGPRWLQRRYDDRDTKVNTYKGFKESLNNWILDRDGYCHASIQDHDLEREFSTEVILNWIASLKGADSSRLVHVLALKKLLEDCIELEWLDPNMANPMDRPVVKKAIKKLVESAKGHRTITVLSEAQIVGLLTADTRQIWDFRRLRYLVALSTALRDHEIQGLVWSDLQLDAAIPHLAVTRQLDKIGPLPARNYRELTREGLTKDEILALPNAIVSPPKRNSVRQVPLLPLVVAALRSWRSVGWKRYVKRAPREEDPLFPSGTNNRHSPPGQFAFVESPELLRMDLIRAGQPDDCKGIPLDFHALRRTFATLLNEKGVSEAEVGELLGHGAKSVARGHYISPDLLGRRLALIERLPLPKYVWLNGKRVEAGAKTRFARVGAEER